jgi:RsiW-degrading membrane proteinase PrsW (M82 family)
MNLAFFASVLPVIFLLVFVYRKDNLQPEPIRKLIGTFFIGCFCVVPAVVLESAIQLFAPVELVPAALYEGFAVAAFSEELCKLLLLYLVVWRSRHFDEYFDGIVYAAFLSLGFACVENIGYVLMDPNAPMQTAFFRGLLAVPAHFLFAVMMGYHFSLAKFDFPHRRRHLFLAFFVPFFLHGTYDALLMVTDVFDGDEAPFIVGGLFLIFFVFDIMMWRWGLKRIKRLQERSKEQNFNSQNPFEGFKW